MAAPKWKWLGLGRIGSNLHLSGYFRFLTINMNALNIFPVRWCASTIISKPKVLLFPQCYYNGKDAVCNISSCLQSDLFTPCSPGKAKILQCVGYNSYRFFSSDEVKHSKRNLMDFPLIIWPNVFYVIRNWILTNFIIRPHLDRDFDISDFLEGAKQGLQVVSNHLAAGNFDELEGLVTPEAINEVKKNISTFSMQSRLDLAVNKDDIFFSFPYQIGIMFNEQEGKERRFVEITVCYHILRGFFQYAQRGQLITVWERSIFRSDAKIYPELRDKIQICNYRFIKEFTKEKESYWTVNIMNHFRLN